MIDKSLETVKVYDKIAEKYSELYDEDFCDAEFLDKFLTFLSNKASILDVGCGTGRSTKYFSDKGYNVIGLDLSKKMIEIAKKSYPNIDFRLGDMRNINLSKKFEGIAFMYSLFHVEKNDALNILKNVKNFLNPKGILFIILQEGNGEINLEHPFMPGGKLYVRLYGENEIKDILIKEGFDVLFIGRRKPKDNEINYPKLAVIARKL